MSAFVITAVALLLVLVLAETGARLYYRLKFGLPFRSKAIAEYPYSRFIEKVDSPLGFRLKKGFRSSMVNINRFCCRGPEPAPDGTRKRIMLIGESNFFGVKLFKESQLWSAVLEKILAQNGHGRWEVLNAGNPTYNSYQHRLLWQQELRRARPDILLVEIGGNDISQAWMMGSRWKPGAPWPWKFIMALERKSSWWNRLLARFCLYFFLRRRMTERKSFPRWDDQVQLEKCLDFVGQNFRRITRDALDMGAKVACLPVAFAYDRQVSPDKARCLEAIQANWRSFVEDRAEYDFSLSEYLRNTLCPELQIPMIDLEKALANHPRRYRLYLDLAHFNPAGHRAVARIIYEHLCKFGWLDAGGQKGEGT